MSNLATWFTPSLQTISRSSGRSSVLAAAYRACIELTDERLGITRDFTPKGKHGLAANICIGIPDDDISKLWNDAEKKETRVNSTVARELMVPLSAEWNDNERRECVRDIAQMLRDKYGVAVLASIHRPNRDSKNDHAHILFTTRTVDAEGNFGKKTRILDDAKTGEVKKMREAVCEIVNTHARANGSDWNVYAGKFADLLEDHIPTKHISISSGKNQRKYIDANRAEVGEAMEAIKKTKNRIAAIDAEIANLQAPPVVEESIENTSPTQAAPQLVLTRRAMPDDATKAHAEIEAALARRRELKAKHDKWTLWKNELEENKPGTLAIMFGSYKGKVAQANRHIELLEDAARKQIAVLQDPLRKKLYAQYEEVIAHNMAVREQELQAQKSEAERLEKLAEENARAYQLEREQESRMDWSTYMGFDQEVTNKRATATTYGDDGYGM
jgi:hypothetical protein